MKIITLIVLIAIYLTSYGQNKLNQKNDNKQKTGLWIEQNESGSITKIVDYSEGIVDGFSITFDTSGQIEKDTLYMNGLVQIELDQFIDTTRFDSLKSLTNKAYLGRKNWEGSYDYINYKNGYPHGCQMVHWNSFKKKQLLINYMGTVIYMINYDSKLNPVSYYSFVGINKPFVINQCLVRNNKLYLTCSNDKSHQVNVPSLKSRTLMHVRGQGKLFHELYYIERDTLFVNLNHRHPNGRYYTFGIQKSKKRFIRKQTNMVNQRFVEKTLMPQESLEQNVKLYLHNTHISWIVLKIDDNNYIFQNNEWTQKNVEINTGKTYVPLKK